MLNTGIMALLPFWISGCEKEGEDDTTDGNNNDTVNNDLQVDLSLSEYSALNDEFGSVKLSSNNIIVINTGGGNYVALSFICTHRSCSLSYNSSANNLPCPCHGSVFDINGNVLEGPATLPLKKYTTVLDGNVLKIDI